MMEGVKQNGTRCMRLGELKGDREIVLVAIKQNGSRTCLGRAEGRLGGRGRAGQDGWALHTPGRAAGYREVVMGASSRTVRAGVRLAELRATGRSCWWHQAECVRAGVRLGRAAGRSGGRDGGDRADGRALQYAMAELRGDWKIVMEAVKRVGAEYAWSSCGRDEGRQAERVRAEHASAELKGDWIS